MRHIILIIIALTMLSSCAAYKHNSQADVLSMVAPVNVPDPIDLASLPAVVVKTVPRSGDSSVKSSTTEIRVTYSKDMNTESWSYCLKSRDSFPKVTGDVRYLKDKRTFVVPVELEPSKTYAILFNAWSKTKAYDNFKDEDGNPAFPYLLVFKTR